MSPARAAAWMVLIAAVAFATAAVEAPTAEPVVAGGFRLVTADLHVHAFPGDGALAPWDIRREARRRGVDVVAITNHNQLHAARLDRALFPDAPAPLTLMGEELTAPGYHLLAVGIREPIDWRLPLASAIRAIHAQDAIAIVAHPTDRWREQIDDEALALLDGVEVAHPVRRKGPSARGQLDALFARAVRLNPTIAAIGASDYHFNAPLGSWRTIILARDLTQDAVFEAIRAGRTVAVDAAGHPFGRPDWTSLVAAGTGLPTADTLTHSLTVALAWLALVFLVIFGRH